MLPLSEFMPDALATVIRKAPLTPEKVAFAWRHAVGAAVDRASAVELLEHRLVVRVDSAQWKREIDRSTTVIRARLEALLGQGAVREIEVVGPPPPRTRKRAG
jgi:hypothetical protein